MYRVLDDLDSANSIICFKATTQRGEFSKIHPRLRAVLWELANFSREKFNKLIVITDLLRTQKEQDDIYSSSANYIAKPWKSVHQFGRGADVRTINYFNQEEVKQILEFINLTWTYDSQRPHIKTVIYHNVDRGAHMHVQVNI